MMSERRITRHGIWLPTNLDDVRSLFASFPKDARFCDLGAGDNRVVDLAAQYCSATGYEIDQGEDMLAQDLSGYDILYYYLLGCARQKELAQRLSTYCGKLVVYYRHCPKQAAEGFLKAVGYDTRTDDDEHYLIVTERFK